MDIVNFIPSFHNFFYKSSSIQRFYSKLIFIHTDVLLDAFSNFTSLPDSYLITFRFSNSLTKDVHRETERETSLLWSPTGHRNHCRTTTLNLNLNQHRVSYKIPTWYTQNNLASSEIPISTEQVAQDVRDSFDKRSFTSSWATWTIAQRWNIFFIFFFCLLLFIPLFVVRILDDRKRRVAKNDRHVRTYECKERKGEIAVEIRRKNRSSLGKQVAGGRVAFYFGRVENCPVQPREALARLLVWGEIRSGNFHREGYEEARGGRRRGRGKTWIKSRMDGRFCENQPTG